MIAQLRAWYKSLVSERHRIALRYALFRIRGWRYRGNAVHCVCCGHSYSRFLPYGNQLSWREHAACPGCNALERNRMVWLYLRDTLLIHQQSWRMLHFAPEQRLEKHLRALPGLHYTTTDLNPEYADIAADIAALPFEDQAFDLVLCSHVLAHVPDEFAALRELHRVTRTGGKTLILTRIDPFLTQTLEPEGIHSPADSLRILGQDDLFRIHGRDYAARLSQAAPWQVTVLYPGQTLTEAERHRLGIRADEAIFVCE